MSNEELERLLNERIVVDIGQLSDENKRWLRRQVKTRRVETMMIYQRYPQPKRGYWIVDR
jgi:hypothetical protein